MKKILLIGKTDSTYTELGDKLSAHYSVRYGSSGGFAAEALLNICRGLDGRANRDLRNYTETIRKLIAKIEK